MKKILILLLTTILSLSIVGCGKKVITTKTCTTDQEDYLETYKLTATNDQIDKVEIVYLYDNELFEVDTLSDLNEEQKDQIKTNMLKTLGLESTTYEGFEVNIDIQDQMTITIKADLTLVDPEVLKKVGLDFSDTNMSLKEAISDMTKAGAVCE